MIPNRCAGQRLECAEEEEGDAVASATDDDKAVRTLDKQILEIFGCRSNNVVASAIFFGGRPRKLLEKLLLGELTAFVSPEIVEEYHGTIQRLQEKYPQKRVNVPLTQIVTSCRLIEPKTVVRVCRDPDDDKFIACAVDSRSLYIVSGDRDLLAVGSYQDVEIVTVSDFFDRVWPET
jgi:putative PIN family toxin of toxin-antitoxin system